MKFSLCSFVFLLFFNKIYSFQNKFILPTYNHNLELFMSPDQIISHFTSFREYTIIAKNDDYKKLEYKMSDHKMNVYYLNLNNLLDTNDILSFLRKKYNNYDTGEDLWIFHKGFFIGSYNDIIQIIDKKNLKKN